MIGGLVWNARTTAAVALVCFLVGVTGGWIVNGWRIGNAIEKQKTAAAKTLAEETEKVRKLERDNDKIRNQAEVDHAKSRDQIERALADNRLLARQLGGLRDPGRRPGGNKPLCRDAKASSDLAATAAESRLSEAGEGLLSPEASDFILEIAAEADRAADYARVCHDWAMRVSP